MNPADRLIVALDVSVDDAFDLVWQLRHQVRWFKLRRGMFFQRAARDLAEYIIKKGNFLMIDEKMYDPGDSIKSDMEEIAKIGAHWVTVHGDCAEHAIGFGPKVLIVRRLTDGTGTYPAMAPFPISDEIIADGFVCHPKAAALVRTQTKKLIVCPGVRPVGSASNNHVDPSTPGDAIRAGADYIVIGRPIYVAPDPVEAARSIVREIKDALCAAP